MSHIARYKTAIVNPDPDVLRGAFQQIAVEMKGTLSQKVFDYYGNPTEVTLALHTPEFQRGLGINWTKDGIEFVVDPWGCEETVETLKKKIIQAYQAIAVMKALTALGYKVKQQQIGLSVGVLGVKQ